MKTLLFTLISLIILASPNIANACSCAGWGSVCGSYASAEAVFVGTVGRVENQIAKGEEGREYIVGQTAYIQVEERFKGAKASELVFRSSGTSCDPTYKEGQRWLFYAYYNKEDQAWKIRACDRSSLLEHAADDLLFLRGLPGSLQKTRVAGVLRPYYSGKPMMGLKVKLVGERAIYETFTDKDGVYEIYGLPPGKYSVQPEVPPTLKVRYFNSSSGRDLSGRRMPQVQLKEKSCARVDITYSDNTIINGRVFGADGRALRNVCVRLWLKDKPADTPFLLDCTDEEGRYKIDDINAGDYFLVANDDGQISSDEPFPLTYYPGVFEKDKATIVTLTSGDRLEDLDFHIPSQQPTRTIRGRLLFSDGRPVAREFVEFNSETKKEGQESEVHTTTDSEGRFWLPVLEGLKGTLRGFMYTYEGEFENCPKLDKLIRARKGIGDIETNRIPMEVNRDFADIELIFPFPFCVKAKEN